jgi:MSHA pilin protein MshA
MKTTQRGFTLIELVMVILILSILAVTAVPKFFDLSDAARQGAVAGVAGGVASGSAINYAARSLNATNGVAVTNCSQVGTLLQEGALPAGYTVAAQAINAGSAVNCVITTTTGSPARSATAAVIGIL